MSSNASSERTMYDGCIRAMSCGRVVPKFPPGTRTNKHACTGGPGVTYARLWGLSTMPWKWASEDGLWQDADGLWNYTDE